MTKVKLSVHASNEALSEVKTVELYELLSSMEGIEIDSASEHKIDKRVPRLTGLELLTTFVTSAAALQLAKAVRDFVKRQSVEVRFNHDTGEGFVLSATGGDSKSLSNLVGFLTKQYQKSVHTERKRSITPTKKDRTGR